MGFFSELFAFFFAFAIYFLPDKELDLARLYGVPVKRLNEQVRRNVRRFPSMIRLTREEHAGLRSQFATLKLPALRGLDES